MTNPALWTAVAGLVTAIGGLVAVIRHANGPKHDPPAKP